MQNWNDGKLQEFADRKTYQVSSSDRIPLKKQVTKPDEDKAEKFVLYTTATCPNCRIIKPILKHAGIPFEERDAEQYMEEVQRLGLAQAPTLVVQGNTTAIYAGVARIKDYLASC